jgi:hypothetical protein
MEARAKSAVFRHNFANGSAPAPLTVWPNPGHAFPDEFHQQARHWGNQGLELNYENRLLD